MIIFDAWITSNLIADALTFTSSPLVPLVFPDQKRWEQTWTPRHWSGFFRSLDAAKAHWVLKGSWFSSLKHFICSRVPMIKLKQFQKIENTVNVWNPNFRISGSVEIRTKASLDSGTFGFQTFGNFGTHTKRSDFSMCLKSKRLNVYHWLLNGLFFVYVLTIPHFASLNK